VQVEGRTLTLTNLGKILYPQTGFSKAEVLDYYRRVASVLLPHIAGRPLTLKRYPEGVDGEAFFQKHVTEHRPDWVATARIPSESSRGRGGGPVTYLVVDGLPALIWAANLAGLELHVPQWRVPEIRRPDLLVFDLDPGEPADIVDCCRVAEDLRPLLEAEGFAPLAKTSGGKGLQLYAPISGVTSEQASDQARAFAERLERDQPRRVVSRMTKVLRTGKVLIDWSQNNGSKTTVAPYSLRARQSPTVSTPVSWDEVAACRRPKELFFTAEMVLDRVDRQGDLFAPLLRLPAGPFLTLSPAFADQQQRIRRQGGVVGDQALADHLLEPGPVDPGLAHVLLLALPLRRTRFQLGGHEVVPALAADAVGAVQEPDVDQDPGPQAGFLTELQLGEILGVAGLPGRPPALREGPGAPPDRVPVLLDQVKAVVLGRDDHREVGLLHVRVGAARPVPPLDLVPPQPHPRVLVDDAGGEPADVCLVRPLRHRLEHLLGLEFFDGRGRGRPAVAPAAQLMGGRGGPERAGHGQRDQGGQLVAPGELVQVRAEQHGDRAPGDQQAGQAQVPRFAAPAEGEDPGDPG
jgi:bifunctional non-homologous end joining protein LigD